MDNKVLDCDNNVEEHTAVNQTLASTPSSSTSGCVSGDDTSDGKSVPASIVTAENYLTISEESQALCSVEDLTKAVEQCKEMVLDSAECSEERKWLVRRLIELRLRLQEAREATEQENGSPTQHSELKVVLGHHFALQNQPAATAKHHCDRCSGVIWSVVHSWYQCSDCRYSCHVKCLPQVCRVCAHVTSSENPLYILDICPEVGLSAQAYRCAECKAHITFTFPKGLSCFGRPFTSGICEKEKKGYIHAYNLVTDHLLSIPAIVTKYIIIYFEDLLWLKNSFAIALKCLVGHYVQIFMTRD